MEQHALSHFLAQLFRRGFIGSGDGDAEGDRTVITSNYGLESSRPHRLVCPVAEDGKSRFLRLRASDVSLAIGRLNHK